MRLASYISKIRTVIGWLIVISIFTACTKLCRYGYEGQHCNELSRPKFLGVWSAIDTPGNLAYVDTISNGTGTAGLIISKNFAGGFFSHAIYASANDAYISIAPQQPDSNRYSVQGSGTISGNESIINWSYQITNIDTPSLTTNYTGIWVK